MARPKESERVDIRAETRRQLLAAATEEFALHGYAGANVNRISRAAGFAKGTIYNYFPSKQALMLALVEEIAKAHLDFIVGQVRAETNPALRLARFFEAGFAFVTTFLAQARVMVNNLYGPHGEFKEAMWLAYQPMFQFVSQEIVAAGINQAVLRPVDPDAMAVLLMTVYLGTASQVTEDGRTWLVPAQVADLVLNGLRVSVEHAESCKVAN